MSILPILNSDVRIEAKPEEMYDGLFGQVLLWVFELLPLLNERQIFPDWRIRAAYYGSLPNGLVIPGVLDLAYEVTPGPRKEINLIRLRGHRHVLGNDWHGLSALWHKYFRIPHRIINRASELGSLSDAVGIHYRGNDKQTALWDTNPVGYQDYLAIINQFCRERSQFKKILLATDDVNFLDFLKGNAPHEVVNLGGIGFHKDRQALELVDAKTDRAMLDCVLLSRCGAVLLTSSALPSFAKIINPDLEIYRVAASKSFKMNTPYFPTAFIPIYRPSSTDIATIIDRLLLGDWTQTTNTAPFAKPFVSRPFLGPCLRLVYSIYFHARGLPGCRWIGELPKLLQEQYRRGRKVRPKHR